MTLSFVKMPSFDFLLFFIIRHYFSKVMSGYTCAKIHHDLHLCTKPNNLPNSRTLLFMETSQLMKKLEINYKIPIVLFIDLLSKKNKGFITSANDLRAFELRYLFA